jgi:hypothetical protein
MSDKSFVWVFNGTGGRFPSGVFSSVQTAELWIARHALTGVLTAYPIDIGVYDWATSSGVFTPKRPEHSSSAFVGTFTSARQEHMHFEGGRRTS